MNKTYQNIFDRPYSLYSPIDKELFINPGTNYLFELENQGLIQIEGDKAVEYLNGQISCNVNEVDNDHIRQGAFCNLKGRILALADIIKWNGLKMILPLDLHDLVINALKKTAMFSRVTFKTPQDYKVFGLLIQKTDDCMPFNMPSLPTKHECIAHDDFLIYALSEELYIVIVRNQKVSELVEPFQNENQFRGSLCWHHLKLTHDMIEIYPSTSGELLPHRVGLQYTGHLDFNKGCYKGQEIIARTHYRAKIKHQLKKFLINQTNLNHEARKLMSTDTHREVGEIVDCCVTTKENLLVLASVLIEHPETGYIEGISEHPIELHEYMG